jgi:hypothetical protein
MAHSLEDRCTPLKLEYDSCFNSWFEGYLEPAVSVSASPENRAEYSKAKAEEYERKCGKIWASYRDCVQVRLSFRLSTTLILCAFRKRLKIRDWMTFLAKLGRKTPSKNLKERHNLRELADGTISSCPVSVVQ